MVKLKNKIPPPVLMLVVGALMYVASLYAPPLPLSHSIRLVGLLVMLAISLVFVAPSLGIFWSHKTTVNPLTPEAASTLITTGIYAITRNPMYVGSVLALLGWGIYLSNILSLLLVSIFFLYIHYVQIKNEEKALDALFGEYYIAYKKRVRRWL